MWVAGRVKGSFQTTNKHIQCEIVPLIIMSQEDYKSPLYNIYLLNMNARLLDRVITDIKVPQGKDNLYFHIRSLTSSLDSHFWRTKG